MRFPVFMILLMIIIITTCTGCVQKTRSDELYAQGLEYNAHSQYDHALDCFNKSLEIDPGSREVWLAKSVALFNMRRFDEAIESVDKALEIDQNYSDAWLIKAEITSARGDKEEAALFYKKAKEKN